MSKHECPVVRVEIAPHPNADAIELAKVGGYLSIVKKGQFQTGDLAVYIPEGSLMPEWLLRDMGFWNDVQAKGTLHGSGGNRVKAIKLRGVLSQGLLYGTYLGETSLGPDCLRVVNRAADTIGVRDVWAEGEDAAEFLGITKYEPALPTHMAGRALGVDTDATAAYDFENLKKQPDLFEDGEPVVITEKIHGTNLQVAVVPTEKANERYYQGRVIITSKGLGAKGIVLDHTDETNLYAQAAQKWGLLDAVLKVLGPIADTAGKPVFLFGEVFGKTNGGAGVQDLTYTGETLDYRAFDISIGSRGIGEYVPHYTFMELCAEMGVYVVPVLYIGPYSADVVREHTDGNTKLTDIKGTKQIREGCVVKSLVERRDTKRYQQRVIAKSVSEAYLLRKGNVTEFA